MKRLSFLFFIFYLGFLHAAEPQKELSFNTQRIQLQQDVLNQYNTILQQEFSDSDAKEPKSVGKALLYSLMIPGAGEWYAGSNGQARFFITTEVLAWTALILNKNYVNSLEKETKTFARLHADVNSNQTDTQFWQNIGKFDDVYSYNERRLQQRRPDEVYETEDIFWKWDERSNRLKYDSKRIKTNDIRNREVYITATLVLNHLVSAINAMRLVRKHNRQLSRNQLDYRFVYDSYNSSGHYWGIQISKSF